MFIGHYGLGYAVKKVENKIPLWMLFTSVQFLDLIAFTFVLLGIEHASYMPSENPFYRNQLNLPFSHSLSGAIIISLIIFMIFWIAKQKRWALILGLCVLSHWFIDLIVHTRDLSLWFGSYEVGLGMWKYPYLSYATEILMVLIGWFLVRGRNLFSNVLLILLILSFTGMTFNEEPEIMKQNDYLRTSLVLISNGIFILLAYLSDRKLKVKPSAQQQV